MKKYDNLDDLIKDYNDKKIDMDTYLEEYNRLWTESHSRFSESCERKANGPYDHIMKRFTEVK